MSDVEVNVGDDDITILGDIQLRDEDGNLYPIGSPPDFQFFSEGTPPTGTTAVASSEDTAGSNAALKLAYDHLRKNHEVVKKQYVKMSDQYVKMSDQLKQKRMLQQATPNISFHVAAASGNVDQIHELLESGHLVNGRNAEGKTALHTAAISSQGNVCSLLLHAKADPNAADIDGKAPIHLAVRNGDEDNTKLLIEFGADVNAMDRDGRTPLHVAAANGHPELCNLLLDSGKDADIDVNQTDLYGQTPLSMAKVNHHHDVYTVLQKAGGMLPVEHKGLTDKSDSSNNDGQQISMLNRMILSLFHILGILCTKVDVIAKFPDIKEKIDHLRLASENMTQYDENKFRSLENTIEDVFDMKQWASQTSEQDHQRTDQTAHILTLEKQLSEVGSELTNVKSQLEYEQRQTLDLKRENTNHLSEISKLRTDAESVDLYSATNLDDDEGELYDIQKLFEKISTVEKNAKAICDIANQRVQKVKGPEVRQIQRTRQASSLPNPQRNQAAGKPRQASSLQSENEASRNILKMHDIKLPPTEHDNTQQAQITVVTNPQRPQQAGFLHYQEPRSPRRQEIIANPRNDSWEDLSRVAGTRRNSQNDRRQSPQNDIVEESGYRRQSPNRPAGSGFVPRSPSRENKPFESTRGPPGFEYASAPSNSRYVEGASQQYIYEDGLSPPPRSNPNQRFMFTSDVAQNIYPSEEGSDHIVLPGRTPQEGDWNGQGGIYPHNRDQIVTSVDQSPYDPQIINGPPEAFLRDPPVAKQSECPVCGRTFAPNTPEENMNAHVNRHFEGSQGGNVDGFEVFPST